MDEIHPRVLMELAEQLQNHWLLSLRTNGDQVRSKKIGKGQIWCPSSKKVEGEIWGARNIEEILDRLFTLSSFPGRYNHINEAYNQET